MTRFAGLISFRRLGVGLLPLATVIACDSPLDLPPLAQEPVAAIEIEAFAGDLVVGQAVTLAARVRAADGALLDRPVTWTSSDSVVADVSSAGVVNARASGTTQITARSGSVTGQVAITVRQQDAVASVEIEAPSADVVVGQVVELTARVRSEDGALLHRQVVWASSDSALAAISPQGVLTARGAGQVRITASVEDRKATATVVIRDGAPAFLTELLPASVPAGSAAFELSIRGTGFQHGATVRLGGAMRPAQVISSTEIRVGVSAEDVRHPGGIEIRVQNPGQTLGSNQMYLIIEHIPSTRTYDLVGLAWGDAGLPVLTGNVQPGGELTAYLEQFVTAGVLRIHQPASGPERWDMTLTMVTKTASGELVKEESLVFFGMVEYPAPGGQRALRSDMFPNILLHTVQAYDGDLIVWQSLHPSGAESHEKPWRYRPRQQ